MPNIAELKQMPDGRLAVILEPFPEDESSITLWTGSERDREIASHVRAAIEECAKVVESYSDPGEGTSWEKPLGAALDEIAKAIRSLSQPNLGKE